ncbi:MAG: GMC family oxidoreductase [Deltaproteobacteria bacterium]|nr:GMC family oxidoreductase [Deltaproteobacteria bacterium]
MQDAHYDWIIIGSGFGGSVSALRLTQKGYRVLVIEKGRRFTTEDFPKTNWEVRRWLWQPSAGLKGIFQMSFFKHVTVVHGVGVGGGSLVYANTLPTPGDEFFSADSWGDLADWKTELAPHYDTALKMLGANPNPRETTSDRVMREIAKDLGREEHFGPTRVAVFFGQPGEEVEDPYFEGDGPRRTGCTFCGACMTGCRVGAKNTLDRNYLYLAERGGAEVLAETEVLAVREREAGGYRVETKASLGGGSRKQLSADHVIFSGGVLGSLPLMLRMQRDPEGLPKLSPRLGDFVRTNNEALIGVVAPDCEEDLTRGVAITSILHTDDHSHLEPVRYGQGSGFFRLLSMPHSPGASVASRLWGAAARVAKSPRIWARAMTTPDYASKSQVLLYMRTLESTLRFRLGRSVWSGFKQGLVSELAEGQTAPAAFIDEANDLARRFAEKIGGVTMTLATEILRGVPSTAHILGGACMGETAEEGVIDAAHRVHGYPGLYVIDGAAISANPGVNPSLTITALAERAMSLIPAREN